MSIARAAALFVDAKGIYPELLGRGFCWANESGYSRDPDGDDARQYGGGMPVVAHPPCNLWCSMAAVNWKRYGRQRPAWYPGGSDGGCFASALANVRRCGGVLEHPAGSHAWEHYKLAVPRVPGWGKNWNALEGNEYVAEVWQNSYGHLARKRTWLLYCGKRPPFELRWDRSPGTHQIGFHDKRGKAANKPTISGKAASATPRAFAEELVRLAEWSRG